MKSLLVALGCMLVLGGCEFLEPSPRNNIRLHSYVLNFDEPTEKNVFWTLYEYNEHNKISKVGFIDTTFVKSSDQFIVRRTIYSYTYDEDAFLLNRKTETQSLSQNRVSEIKYEYVDGRLDSELFENRITEYRYNSDGTVKETISTSLFNGGKRVLPYFNNIPEGVNKVANGYLQEDDDEKLYYDEELREVKYEKYFEGQLFLERLTSYIAPKIHLASLPNFKGFPAIKDFAFRNGIEERVETYIYENGTKILTDSKSVVPSYNSAGYVTKVVGTEMLNMNTANPVERNLEFLYYYENY